MNIKLILGDITQLEVDIIVNAAKSSLRGGGGVDGGGGPGSANTFVTDKKNTARIIIILFGTIFIVRKSIKKIYLPK